MTIDQLNNTFRRLQKEGGDYLQNQAMIQEANLINIYQESLNEINRMMTDLYAKYGQNVSLQDLQAMRATRKVQNDIVRMSRWEIMESQIRDEMHKLQRRSVNSIKSSLKSNYQDQYYLSAYASETTIGRSLGFGSIDPKTVELSLLNPQNAIKWPESMTAHVSQLNSSIRSAIATGLNLGHGFNKIAADYRDRMFETIGNRFDVTATQARRIVRTESMRIKSEARNAVYKKSERAADKLGLTLQHRWSALSGLNHRHYSMNNTIADENGEWTLPTGAKTTGPGLSGDPNMDINCECNTETVIDELEDGPPIEPKDESFQQWAKRKKIKSNAMKPVNVKPPKPEAGTARTVKEAEDFAKQAGFADNVSFKGISVDSANIINKTLATYLPKDIKYDFIGPQAWVADNLGISRLQNCIAAHIRVQYGLTLRYAGQVKDCLVFQLNSMKTPKIWDDVLNRMNNAGTIKNMTKESTIIHEIGHAVDYYLSRNMKASEQFSSQFRINLFHHLDNDVDTIRKRLKDILGSYCNSKPVELFAELFRGYHQGLLPDDMNEIMEKTLKGIK